MKCTDAEHPGTAADNAETAQTAQTAQTEQTEQTQEPEKTEQSELGESKEAYTYTDEQLAAWALAYIKLCVEGAGLLEPPAPSKATVTATATAAPADGKAEAAPVGQPAKKGGKKPSDVLAILRKLLYCCLF